MPIFLTLIALSSGINFGKSPLSAFVSVVLFKALVLNIIPMWGWVGTRPKGLGR